MKQPEVEPYKTTTIMKKINKTKPTLLLAAALVCLLAAGCENEKECHCGVANPATDLKWLATAIDESGDWLDSEVWTCSYQHKSSSLPEDGIAVLITIQTKTIALYDCQGNPVCSSTTSWSPGTCGDYTIDLIDKLQI